MRAGIVAIVLFLCAGIAHAQTTEERPAPPPTPPSTVDPQQGAYDAAFQAMLDGDLVTAETGFDAVAQSATDPELAAAARELGKMAHALAAKNVTFATAATVNAGATAEDRDQGRSTFVVWTTFYSIYAGSVMVADFGISDAKGATVLIMGSTAAGLVGSIYGTRHRKMTGAMGDAYSVGMLGGIGNALLLLHPAWPSASGKEWVTTALASGALGGVGGLIYGDRAAPTRGQVSFASTLSLMGLASVWLGYGILDPSNISGNTVLVSSAAGLDLGLGAGLYFGHDLGWSSSRARLVQLGAVVGGLFGGGLGFLITSGNSGDNNVRLVTGAALAGAWGGLALGTHVTAGMRPDRRYLKTTTTVAPMVTSHGGGGLSLVGTF